MSSHHHPRSSWPPICLPSILVSVTVAHFSLSWVMNGTVESGHWQLSSLAWKVERSVSSLRSLFWASVTASSQLIWRTGCMSPCQLDQEGSLFLWPRTRPPYAQSPASRQSPSLSLCHPWYSWEEISCWWWWRTESVYRWIQEWTACPRAPPIEGSEGAKALLTSSLHLCAGREAILISVASLHHVSCALS